MLCTIFVGDMLAAANLQVLPDQVALLEPVEASQQIQEAVASTTGKRRRKRDSVYATAVAVFHAVLQRLPYESIAVYAPSVLDDPKRGSERRWSESEGQHYRQNPTTKVSQWSLAPELLGPVRPIRILLFACDEGATGYSLYSYLAGPMHLRCLFQRDPSHRLTVAFVASLRAHGRVLQALAQNKRTFCPPPH